MKGEHPYVKWAIKSIEAWLKEKRLLNPLKDGAPVELLKEERVLLLASINWMDLSEGV